MDKKAIQLSFSKAASYYDKHAELQRDIGHHLMTSVADHLKKTNEQWLSNPLSILDLGCGTGYFSALLANHYSEKAQITCFDLSPAMLKQTAQRGLLNCNYVEGDIDKLPFHQKQFDLIFSNLVMQWSEQLSHSLMQARQVLNKNGTLSFSTLLDGTLTELQYAWKKVDDKVHVNEFLTKQEVVNALYKAGFTEFTLHTETHIKKYKDVVSVMKALKGIGANHVNNGTKPLLTGRKLLQQLENGYQTYRDQDGLYNLSYQVCYVIAVTGNE